MATLAMNSPVGVLLSAFLFGMLRSASISMSLTSQVTTEMISVLQALSSCWWPLRMCGMCWATCGSGSRAVSAEAGNRKELLNNGFLDLICQLFCPLPSG